MIGVNEGEIIYLWIKGFNVEKMLVFFKLMYIVGVILNFKFLRKKEVKIELWLVLRKGKNILYNFFWEIRKKKFVFYNNIKFYLM